jgi:ubiquitin carboxyl-terminal hydrolase 5/13
MSEGDSKITHDLLQVIRSEFSKLKVPASYDKVYNDECVMSFDRFAIYLFHFSVNISFSPYSETGLYVNLSTLMGFGESYYKYDSHRTGAKLYLHELWTQIKRPVEEREESAAPTLLAIGVEGGFNAAPKFETVKEFSLVVLVNDDPVTVSLSDPKLPEFVRNVCQAIIEHQGMRTNLQVNTWVADQDIFESKYATQLPQLNNGKIISNDPKSWKCEASGETQNLWLNLSTGYVGGGRKHWDGTGGSGAALQHFIDTGKQYPLCVKLGIVIYSIILFIPDLFVESSPESVAL